MEESYSKQVVIDIEKLSKDIYYSDKYFDDDYEYRHVIIPKPLTKLVPKDRLMCEDEWRSLGVQQSRGWVHYMIHDPEPHMLLFRRSLNFAQQIANGGEKIKSSSQQQSTIVN